MKTLNINQYHTLRNKLWSKLVTAGVVSDIDDDWETFDVILGENLPVDWENQDKDSLMILHNAQLN